MRVRQIYTGSRAIEENNGKKGMKGERRGPCCGCPQESMRCIPITLILCVCVCVCVCVRAWTHTHPICVCNFVFLIRFSHLAPFVSWFTAVREAQKKGDWCSGVYMRHRKRKQAGDDPFVCSVCVGFACEWRDSSADFTSKGIHCASSAAPRKRS